MAETYGPPVARLRPSSVECIREDAARRARAAAWRAFRKARREADEDFGLAEDARAAGLHEEGMRLAGEAARSHRRAGRLLAAAGGEGASVLDWHATADEFRRRASGLSVRAWRAVLREPTGGAS